MMVNKEQDRCEENEEVCRRRRGRDKRDDGKRKEARKKSIRVWRIERNQSKDF